MQAAIDAAAGGDIIEVAPGTYTGSIDFGGKDVAVAGTGGSAATFLVSDGGGPAVRFSPGGPGALSGFDITGGDTADGTTLLGGCLHVSGSSPLLQDLRIHGCRGHLGGGAWLHNSGATLDSVILQDNEALPAGDEWGFGGGLYATDSDLLLQDVSLLGNSALRGGGAMLSAGTAAFVRPVVTGNSAERAGGLSLQARVVTLDDAQIVGNSALELGGGLWISSGGAVTAQGGALSDNTAGGEAVIGAGGGARITESSLAWSDGVASGNRALGPPGDDSTGGALRVDNGSTLVLERVTMENNDAGFGAGILVQESTAELTGGRIAGNTSASSGAGLYVSASSATLTAVTVHGNVAGGDGGGVRAQDGVLTIRNSVFTANQAGNGAAIHLFGDSDAELLHVTAVGNAATTGGSIRATFMTTLTATNCIVAFPAQGSCFSAPEEVPVVLRYTDSWNPAGPLYSGGMTDRTGIDGSINADPLLLSWTDDGVDNDDLHLSAGSPAVDAGDPTSSLDPDGSAPDLGAYGGAWSAAWESSDGDGDGFRPQDGDCDDEDPAVNPDAEEVCNGVDDDCDLLTDEGCGDDDDAADDDDSAGDDDDAGDDDAGGEPPVDPPSVEPPPAESGCDCGGGGGAFLLVPLLGLRRRRLI